MSFIPRQAATAACLVALAVPPRPLPIVLPFHLSLNVAPTRPTKRHLFSPQSPRSPLTVPPLPTPSPLCMALGELASPRPPLLDGNLIKAATERLPWEMGDSEEAATSERENEPHQQEQAWEDGELWYQTRETLVKLWVLPRDMTNGADANWAAAATRREFEFLSRAPQLLRLPPSCVVDTAKAVMRGFCDDGDGIGAGLRLPPALLRSEPELLVFPSSYVRGGLNLMGERFGKDEALKTCQGTPGALREAVEDFIQETCEKLT